MRKEKLEELKSIIEELKTVQMENRKIKQNSKFLQSEAYYFTLNNGITISREKLLKGGKNGSATITIPITSENEVLVVVEPRVFTNLTVGIGFPAGYMEENESVKTSALRELQEETGYTSEKIIEIDSFYQDEGCSSALNHILLAFDCQKVSEQSLDQDEIVRYMLFHYEELFELEKMGYIKGGNTKLALEKSKKYVRGNEYERF